MSLSTAALMDDYDDFSDEEENIQDGPTRCVHNPKKCTFNLIPPQLCPKENSCIIRSKDQVSQAFHIVIRLLHQVLFLTTDKNTDIISCSRFAYTPSNITQHVM